jgi:very-short-patch-repair endonuclease
MVYQNNRINNLKRLEINRKNLRNHPTEAEQELWKYIRKRKLSGRKLRRQFSVLNYILDFYCFEEKLAIELDGQPHFNWEGRMIDAERDAFLCAQEITVLRFENRRVFEEMENVLAEIQKCFK